jgi:multidrug efflux pump subunit AcrB
MLRAELPKRFPGIEFFFQPADIVTQILNFGLPAAIDVQFSGNDWPATPAARGRTDQADPPDPRRGRRARAPAPGRPRAEPADGPHAAAAVGLTASNVGQNVLIALSGSSQTAPAFWLNPVNGVVYSIAVQSAAVQVDSLDSLLNIPVGAGGANAGGTGIAAAAGQPGRPRRPTASCPSCRATTSRPPSTCT